MTGWIEEPASKYKIWGWKRGWLENFENFPARLQLPLVNTRARTGVKPGWTRQQHPLVYKGSGFEGKWG